MYLENELVERPRTLWKEKADRYSGYEVKSIPRPVIKVPGILSGPVLKGKIVASMAFPSSNTAQDLNSIAMMDHQADNDTKAHSRWLSNNISGQGSVKPNFTGLYKRGYSSLAQTSPSHTASGQATSTRD